MASPRRQDAQSFVFAGSPSPTSVVSSDELWLPYSSVRPAQHDHHAMVPPPIVFYARGQDPEQPHHWQQQQDAHRQHQQQHWRQQQQQTPQVSPHPLSSSLSSSSHGLLKADAAPLRIPTPMPSPPLNYLGCEPMIFPPKEDAGRMVARLALPSQPSHISAAPITTGYKRHGSNARVLRPKKVQKTKATLGPLYDVYLAPSPELLAQGRLPHMGALRPGLFHGKVGLLLGLRGDFMQKYEKPPKGRRAPREDLSVYTAEEKVERRKARAREYSNTARVRQEAAESEFKFDLGFMRSFRMMIEDAPNMFAVVTPDLEASVVYANGAFDRVANMAPKMVVGKPLWALIHEADHAAFREALVSVILTKKPPAEHVACRLVRKPSDGFLDVQVSLAMGTQGVLCVFWVV